MIIFGDTRPGRETRQLTVPVSGAPETTDHISRFVSSDTLVVELERLGGGPWKLSGVAVNGRRTDGGASHGQRDSVAFGRVALRRAPAWAVAHAEVITHNVNALEGLS